MTTRVLVVGGAGYIGAHTCKALARSGFIPITYDNLSTGHRSFVKWGPFYEGHIGDTNAIAATIRDSGAEAIIHFAACAYVGESVADPAKYYENNVAGTLGLLRGAKAAGCKRIVFSSTCAVYGEPKAVPVGETSEARPVNPYGRSKLMVEQVLHDYQAAYGMTSIILRYFNACGADLDHELGELRNPETHLIPRALMTLLGHIDDFAVFGTDFPTPDGTAVRDYIHVTDLADAHTAAVRALLDGSQGGVYNLGTGRGISVKDVLCAIRRHTGLNLRDVSGVRRPGDPAMLIADPRLAKRVLGFVPRHSNLDTIIDTAWAWHQVAHPNRANPCEKGTSLPAFSVPKRLAETAPSHPSVACVSADLFANQFKESLMSVSDAQFHTQPAWHADIVEEVTNWVLAGNVPPAPHILKMAMVKEFAVRSGAKVFVETGTYEGATTATIAETGMNVITVELSEQLHAEAECRFAEFSNVQCMQGDSGKLMPIILSKITAPAVFWLDGHYSAGKTAFGDRITPLVEELFYIFHHALNSHVVLIDDVRCFNGESYPSVAFITEMTRLYWPDSRVDVLHDILRIRPSSFPI